MLVRPDAGERGRELDNGVGDESTNRRIDKGERMGGKAAHRCCFQVKRMSYRHQHRADCSQRSLFSSSPHTQSRAGIAPSPAIHSRTVLIVDIHSVAPSDLP